MHRLPVQAAIISRSALCAAAFLLGSLVISNVFAHGAPGAVIKARVDTLPAALGHLAVQVHETVSTQVVIANDVAEPLTILDDQGQPFLRLQQDGVLANVHAPAYYATRQATKGDRMPEAVRDAQEQGRTLPVKWRRISARASWGWFDPRISTDDREAPHAVKDAGERARVGDWSLPVRYAGNAYLIRGGYYYEPLPRGSFESHITSDPQLAEGVVAGIAPGPSPALYVRNTATSTVTVLDGNGQPWYRIERDGAYRAIADAQAKTRWIRISGGGHHSWIDPRAGYAQRRLPSGMQRKEGGVRVKDWTVPLTIDGESAAVTGRVVWRPLPEPPRKPQSSGH